MPGHDYTDSYGFFQHMSAVGYIDQKAEVVDRKCICSSNVLVQSVYPRPTTPSTGDSNLW